ncbi:transcriptional activator, Rgg/GadR/MutR family, C-terminal domain-containing protein [Pilibacter termitis]|uniref:Transcriptional activator, Rgg/GadR/MutR family, C-terminal domain-containing protein n=1 Tax=Pilibacter termitis TaxID=263852 RepID=A0A1T4M0Z0_9ENTE|nr:Rgg/GadR/MutR family transcriptional regulator [Pilibacter termitis]SJZ60555.1 transcriptional activator, Rgg/GadR/MutR family, C-terminal domain-containing protein [Pilibacter termitis]
MEYFGKTFKEIRENRNFSLSDVCEEHISTAQFSRFEKGKTDISISRFYKSLKRLGVSLEEFEYILSGYQQSERNQLLEKLSKAYVNNDTDKIKSLLDKQEKRKNSSDEHDKWNYYMLKSIWGLMTEQEYLTTNEIKEMAGYLFSIEDWGYYQLVFYTNTITSYEFKTVMQFSKELVMRTAYYRKIPKNRQLVIQALLNTIYICAFKQKLKEGLYYQQIVQELLDETDLYYKTVLLVMSGLLDCIDSKLDKGKDKVDRAIQIFRDLDSDTLAKSYQQDYQKILALIEKS